MFIKVRLKSQLILAVAISSLTASTILSQQNTNNVKHNSQSFNIGIFSVVGNNPWSPIPGTQAFRDELELIWVGTNTGYNAINSMHTYGHYIGDSTFWTNYLSDVSTISDSLKTLADCRFEWIDINNDSLISQNELDEFISVFSNFVNSPNTEHILGWYIADEPSAHDYDSVEVNKIYSAIKQLDNRPIYIAEGPGETNYARFLCDILIIDNYYYSINGFADLATLAMWRYLIPRAREQLKNTGRDSTEIHALLVLGEEIYPDSLNEEFMASHGLTHSAIKHILELGAEGVWFYAWRAGVINEEDAVGRWIDNQYYAEVVETEFHDRDFLVTAFNGQNKSKIVISDNGNGQPPDEGLIYQFNKPVDAIVSNDFQGSNDLEGNTILYDLSYRLEEGFRSSGDGDDELVTAFHDGSVYYNENGNKPDESLLNTILGNISAMTSGDFDGDGDSEIVTAVKNENNCYLFVSDDGQEGSIIEYQIYSSIDFEITALTAGDFDGDGRDKLVTAVSNLQSTESSIYVDDISATGSAGLGSPWFSSNDYLVTALAAGDFESDNMYKDRLIIALSNSELMDSKIYCTSANSFSFDSSIVFFGPDDYWHVTSMAFGDFINDNNITEEMLFAFSNNSFDHSTIYKTDNPEINGVGVLIYDSGASSDYYVKSMTSASFRESLHPVTFVNEGQLPDDNNLSDSFFLFQNYPNPFNPETTIKFHLAEFGFISLKVFDVLGREVSTLMSEEKRAGEYKISFNASALPSGVYFYQLRKDNHIKSKKMLLLR